MRVRSLLFPILVAVLVLAPQTLAQPTDEEFAAMVAGAWLGEGQFALDFECDGVPDVPATPFAADSQSFTASGLYLATNPANPNLYHGTWERFGDYTLRGDTVGYINAGATVTLPTPPGLPWGRTLPVVPGGVQWYVRIPGTFTFSEDFTTATGTFGARLYLSPAALLADEPFICSVGEHFMLRKVTPDPAVSP